MVSFIGDGKDFKCMFRPSGTHCEIIRKKDKSRESGGIGQEKQPWGVGGV